MNLYKEFYRKYKKQDIHTIPISRFNSLHEIIKSLNVEGDTAELGVAFGGTIKLINHYLKDRTIYAYDTFEGFAALPKEFTKEENKRWKDWGSKDQQLRQWKEEIKELNTLENVQIRKGVFPFTANKEKDKTFSFVHIDTDIYFSTMIGLEFFYPRMVKGGTIVIDDLFKPGDSRFNQVQRAVQHYFKDKGLDYKELVDFKDNIGHGVIIKG